MWLNARIITRYIHVVLDMIAYQGEAELLGTRVPEYIFKYS